MATSNTNSTQANQIIELTERLNKYDIEMRRRAGDRTAFSDEELDKLDRHTATVNVGMKLIGSVHTEARRHEYELMVQSMIEQEFLKIKKQYASK